MEVEGKNSLNIMAELAIGSKTLTNWRRMPAYKAALIEHCRNRFASLVPKAIRSLERLLEDKDTPAMAAVRAADLILKGAALVTGQAPIDGAVPEQGDQTGHGVVLMPAKRAVQHADASKVQTVVATHRAVTMEVD